MIVLDASVIAKWFLEEKKSSSALDFGSPFVTADEKLYQKIKDLNFVKLL